MPDDLHLRCVTATDGQTFSVHHDLFSETCPNFESLEIILNQDQLAHRHITFSP